MTMDIFLFYENRKLKGIFSDEKELKRQTLIHILNLHVVNKNYKNIKDAGKFLKSKIQKLFKSDINFMENLGNTWSIVKVSDNKIIMDFIITNYNSEFKKISIKGKDLNKKDINKNMDYLDLNSFYN